MLKSYLIMMAKVFILMLLFNTEAFAQTHIQTDFVQKRGWLRIDNTARALVFDTIANPAYQNISTNYVDLSGYHVLLYSRGALYVSKREDDIIEKQLYPDPKRGGWPAELVAYSQHKLLFKSTTDGYIRPRVTLLVEADLQQGTYRIIDKGRKIQAVLYSDDLKHISYNRNGVDKGWGREEAQSVRKR